MNIIKPSFCQSIDHSVNSCEIIIKPNDILINKSKNFKGQYSIYYQGFILSSFSLNSEYPFSTVFTLGNPIPISQPYGSAYYTMTLQFTNTGVSKINLSLARELNRIINPITKERLNLKILKNEI